MRLLLLLLLIPAAFAQYAPPPIASVMANNTIAAANLDGSYNESLAQNGTISIWFPPYSQALGISASVDIVALSPEIDGMSCTTEGLAVIFERGYSGGHLTSLPSEGYPDFICDREWFAHISDETAWRCDFDSDFCAEYENQSIVRYDMNVTFAFRNASATVPFSGTYIEVPQDIMAEMKSASGAENLSVSAYGDIVFIYQINNRSYGYGDCGSDYYDVTQSIPFSVNRTFTVGGEKKLFFLRSPVLREQWFRNNRFDMIVLSQCPLYHADIYMNGNITDNLALRDFWAESDDNGIQRIVSRKTNRTGFSESTFAVINPAPLEFENDSFLYAYEFNHSFSGLGESNLSLLVKDSVLSSASFNDSLMSRMLSFNGLTSESGLPASLVPSRPSSEPVSDSLAHLQISLGLIALILILAFVNSWLV